MQLMMEMSTLIPIEDWLTVPQTDFLAILLHTLRVEDFQILSVSLLQKMFRHQVKDNSVVVGMQLDFLAADKSIPSFLDDTEHHIKFLRIYATVLSGSLFFNWSEIMPVATRDPTVAAKVQRIVAELLSLVSQTTSIRSAGESLLDIFKVLLLLLLWPNAQVTASFYSDLSRGWLGDMSPCAEHDHGCFERYATWILFDHINSIKRLHLVLHCLLIFVCNSYIFVCSVFPERYQTPLLG